MHGGARAGGGLHPEPAAERLHPVLEPDQAGAAGEVGAAAAVVAHPDPQYVACGAVAGVAGAVSRDVSISTATTEACACLAALVSASATR